MLNVWIEVESCEVSGPESMRGEERGELEKAKRGRHREIREQAEKKTQQNQQGFLELLDSSLVTAITEKASVQ